MAEEQALVPSNSNSSDNTNRGSTLLVGNVAKYYTCAIQYLWDGGIELAGDIRTHLLGDGQVRVKAGELLEHADEVSAQDYGFRGHVPIDFSSTDDQRPDHPPNLAPWQRWRVIEPDVYGLRDLRHFQKLEEEDDVVIVLREGYPIRTHVLLHYVNMAHAVLVRRVLPESTEYFYPHNDFVMSVDEEESLLEWGVGRSMFGNYALAVGGMLLVAFAEQVWKSAMIGTLLVAAALYRVQGVLTKVLRVGSPEWKCNKLVPSGTHGTERVVQLVLVVLVVLGHLLEDRILLLAALSSASMYTILLEFIGQAVTTFGWKTYLWEIISFVSLMIVMELLYALLSWLIYVFAGAFSCIILIFTILVVWVRVVQRYPGLNRNHTWETVLSWLFILTAIGVVGRVASMDWKEADLKWSIQSLQPWRWSKPGYVSVVSVLRLTGLWICAVVISWGVILVAFNLFIPAAFDHSTKPRGKRTWARKDKGEFSHYHESCIPSRNLIVPSATP